MIDQEFIKYIRKEKRFKLSLWQYVQAYSFPIGLVIYVVYFLIDSIFFNELKEGQLERLIHIFIYIAVAFVLLVWQRKRTLKFKKIKCYPTENEFKRALRTTEDQMNWRYKYKRSDFIIASFKNSMRSRETQEITIFYDEEGIHINSMTELWLLSFPFSFGNRMQGIRNFAQNLEYEMKGIESQEILDEKNEAKENESEWTYDNIVKRVFAYFLILIWTALFVGFLWSGSYIAALIFSPIIILSFFYIYFDVKVILEKRKKNNKL